MLTVASGVVPCDANSCLRCCVTRGSEGCGSAGCSHQCPYIFVQDSLSGSFTPTLEILLLMQKRQRRRCYKLQARVGESFRGRRTAAQPKGTKPWADTGCRRWTAPASSRASKSVCPRGSSVCTRHGDGKGEVTSTRVPRPSPCHLVPTRGGPRAASRLQPPRRVCRGSVLEPCPGAERPCPAARAITSVPG